MISHLTNLTNIPNNEQISRVISELSKSKANEDIHRLSRLYTATGIVQVKQQRCSLSCLAFKCQAGIEEILQQIYNRALVLKKQNPKQLSLFIQQFQSLLKLKAKSVAAAQVYLRILNLPIQANQSQQLQAKAQTQEPLESPGKGA